jgi:hypothetical protein
MTNTITVSLTDTQKKAIEYLVINPQEFLNNFAHETARKSVDEILSIYTTRALDEGVVIPATRELIVADAFTRGWIKTAAQVNAEAEASETP